MKLFGIIEVYQDYKGADATNWGVKKTLKEALETLRGIIEQQFQYIRENIIDDIEDETCQRAEDYEIDSRWTEWVNDRLDEGSYDKGYSYKWEYYDGDSYHKFYIDEIELDDYISKNMKAYTKKGTEVYLSFVPDCESNVGGWFVEIHLNVYGDWYDYFCIHPEDCDCTDWDAVEKVAKEFVSEIDNY